MMIRRALISGVAALTLVAAGSTGTRTGADDRCGDLLHVRSTYVGPTEVVPQPDRFAGNDIDRFTVTTVRNRAGRPAGVDWSVVFCGPTSLPDEGGESIRLVWTQPNGCDVEAYIGQRSSDGALYQELSRTCLGEPGPGGVYLGSVETVVPLRADAISVSGRTLTVRLRSSQLGALGPVVAKGARLRAPNVYSNYLRTPYGLQGWVVGVAYEVDGDDWAGYARDLIVR